MISTKPSLPKIVSLEQTCSACPSQWDAQTSDGRYVYIRYRWGTLRVDIAPSKEAWAKDRTVLYHEQCGGPMAGDLSTDDMKRLVSSALTFRWPL